jgi:hypothetical protein
VQTAAEQQREPWGQWASRAQNLAELVSWGSGGRVSGPSGPSSQCEAPPGGRVTSPGPGLPRRASLLQGPHCRGRLPGDTTTSRSLQGWGVLQAAVQAPGGPPYAGVAPVSRGRRQVTTQGLEKHSEVRRGRAAPAANLLYGKYSWHFSFLALLYTGTFTS